MKRRALDYLVSPLSGNELELRVDRQEGDEIIEGVLSGCEGEQYPIVRGIPRFVSSAEYTGQFGFQWNRHSRIYSDEKDKRRVYSRQRQLERKLGLSGRTVQDQLVLDVGCGTGANASTVAGWGAREVFCVDLSSAVEAAFANTNDLPNVHVVQADLTKLPFRQKSFDIVYSIGVLHHTTDTRKAFASLVPFLTADAMISIWVYADQQNLGQRLSDRVRKVTTKMHPRVLYALCWLAVPAYYVRRIPLLGAAIFHFLPPVSLEPSWEDRVLDTFDWYAPTYQWKHTYPEVYSWFREANLTDIHLQEVPVSMRGRRV